MSGVARRAILSAALITMTALAPSRAPAAGFLVQEKSPRGLGSSFAGEGVLAEDASITYFNPAGLTLLDGLQVVAGAHEIMPEASFENHGSHLNPKIGNGPLRGSNSDGGEFAFIPTTYVSYRATDWLGLGIGVNAPFGLATEWDKGWVGRYHALKSALRSIAVTPSVGLKVTDWLSFGLGMSALYAKATLTSAIDLGGVCTLFAPGAGLPSSICPAIGLKPQSADGLVRITGDDWGFGWNLGMLLTPTPGTRVGLTYRSSIDLNLSGDSTFTVPKKAKILQSTGALVDTGVHAATTLPDVVSLSAMQEINPRWAVFGDVTWTHWDHFQDLIIKFDNPKQPTVVDPERWDNSFRVALGTRYALTRDWSVRAGTAWDQTPVPSARYRTARIPDSDRVWASLGLGYQLFEWARVDLSYAHVFGMKVSTTNRDPVTGHELRGTFEGGADIVGVQASLRLW